MNFPGVPRYNAALLIRADASARIGAGHLMRCMALAHAFRERGWRPIFAACELPEVLQQRIVDEGYEFRRVDAVPGSDEDARRTLEIAKHANASNIAVDLYDGSVRYLDKLSAGGAGVLCIDDNASLTRYPADFVLNLNGHAQASQYESKIDAPTRLLLGPRYALLRREFLPFRDWERPLPPEPRRILVSLGGGNQIPAFVSIVERLAGVLRPFELSFVLARPDFDTAPLDACVAAHGITGRMVIAPPDMAVELSRHDALISSGGSTVWEALYMQMPAVFVAIAANQVNSCLALRKMVRHPVFTSIDEIAPDAVAAVLHDSALRVSLAQSGRSIVDGYGAGRVVSEISAPLNLCQNQATH